MQTLDVQIKIPDDHILITRTEYEDLTSNVLLGKYLTLQDVMEHTGKSRPWLEANLLSHPIRKKQIEPFTHFPQGQGDRWAFKAKEMYEYLDREFLKILKRGA